MLLTKDELLTKGLVFLRDRVHDLELNVELYINATAGDIFAPEHGQVALRNISNTYGECRGIANALAKMGLITSQESTEWRDRASHAYEKAYQYVMGRTPFAIIKQPPAWMRIFLDWELLGQVKIEVDRERGTVTIMKEAK